MDFYERRRNVETHLKGVLSSNPDHFFSVEDLATSVRVNTNLQAGNIMVRNLLADMVNGGYAINEDGMFRLKPKKKLYPLRGVE